MSQVRLVRAWRAARLCDACARAYDAGKRAAESGASVMANPFTLGADGYRAWRAGWESAHDAETGRLNATGAATLAAGPL